MDRLGIIDGLLKPPIGRLQVSVFDRGALVEFTDHQNLIVVGSQLAHAKTLGGASGFSITQFGVGTSIVAPAFGNTTLTSAFLKNVDAVDYPTANQVRFALTLGTGNYNGSNIGEFGLLTSGGLLYARVARATALAKTSSISLSAFWTITFP